MAMEQAIKIGIDKLTAVQKMAGLIKTADTKEDILYILKNMEDQLEEGIKEIDKINGE